MSTQTAPHNAVIIFGPTAVGKTDVLRHLTEYPIEVISADSRQVYKGMEIVSATPPPQFQKRVPHHLVGILDITQNYTMYNFVADTHRIVQEIYARQRIPLIIGGAAFYLYHLCKGVPATPTSQGDIRLRLTEELKDNNQEHMYQKLKEKDPEYANTIAPTDSYRTLRALEVFETTHQPLSNFNQHDTSSVHGEFLVIGLRRTREQLYKRINLRVHTMIQNGLIEEVRLMWKRGLSPNHNAYRTIGVQEFLNTAEVVRAWEENRSIDTTVLKKTVETIQRNSRRYAKRQITFFNKFSFVKWVALSENEHENLQGYKKITALLSETFGAHTQNVPNDT